jgi:hypothetical protein
MVTTLAAAKSSTEQVTKQHSWPSAKAAQYAFDYEDETISELEQPWRSANAAEAEDSSPGIRPSLVNALQTASFGT